MDISPVSPKPSGLKNFSSLSPPSKAPAHTTGSDSAHPMIQPLSPLSDIEEVPGPLPLVINNIGIGQETQHLLGQIKEGENYENYETNQLGY
jgi:hypothetical protein